VYLEGLHGVMRAGRVVSTGGREYWRDDPLINANKKYKGVCKEFPHDTVKPSSNGSKLKRLIQGVSRSVFTIFKLNTNFLQFVSNSIACTKIFIGTCLISQLYK